MGIGILLGQCAAMAAASMAVGSLPLVLNQNVSAVTLSGIHVLGMGLLVGAALAIIIPEGVKTMYEADPNSSHAMGISLLLGFALMLLVENLSPHPPHHPEDLESVSDHDHEHDHAHPPRPCRSGSRTHMIPKESPECETHAAAHGLSATLGLVIHGAADGIALGASSLTGRAELSLVVFLAVLVHKAALGLTTTLLSLHLSPAQVRRRLVVFSLAAPAGALATYLLALALGISDSEHSLGWWTGAILLFSGGSFLYVATVLQPISQTGPDDHCHDVHHEVHREDTPPMPKSMRGGLILAGMALPVALSLLVSHDH